MTADEARIWDLLQNHRGHESAIRQADLAELAGVSVRTLQDVLKDLTETHRKPVVSACRPPYGSYVPADDAEVQEYVAQLRSRALSCFKRVSALSSAAARELHREVQQELFGAQGPNLRVAAHFCPQCRGAFEPTRRGVQVYCSQECRYAAAEDRRAS